MKVVRMRVFYFLRNGICCPFVKHKSRLFCDKIQHNQKGINTARYIRKVNLNAWLILGKMSKRIKLVILLPVLRRLHFNYKLCLIYCTAVLH